MRFVQISVSLIQTRSGNMNEGKISSQMVCIQIYVFMVNDPYNKYIYSLSDMEKEHIN